MTGSGDDNGHLLVAGVQDAGLSLVFVIFAIVSNNLFLVF